MKVNLIMPTIPRVPGESASVLVTLKFLFGKSDLN